MLVPATQLHAARQIYPHNFFDLRQQLFESSGLVFQHTLDKLIKSGQIVNRLMTAKKAAFEMSSCSV